MKRGEIYWVASFKEFGKVRPAVVVQADAFNETPTSVTVCLLTGEQVDAPLFRLDVPATKETGLDKPSQIMADKLMTMPATRIKEPIGKVPARIMSKLDESLRLWLSL